MRKKVCVGLFAGQGSWIAGLVVVALALTGCEFFDLDPLDPGDDNNTNGPGTNQQTPTGGNTSKCAVSAQNTPQGVPLAALTEAEDTVAGYGNALNEFWKLNACVYRADPGLYALVRQNAISYNIPPVIVYDPGLFERFWNEWRSHLPTMLIVAHEWGHQVQYANNAWYSTTFEYEQDADMRAGYYMGVQAQSDGSANVEDVGRLLKEFACTTGDPDSVPWFTEGAHGSCEQRANAVISGFNQGVRTSTIGRGALSQPGQAAPTAGSFEGTMLLRVTVVDAENIAVGQQNVPYDYDLTIGPDGRVIDEQGLGPLPDVGDQRIIPVRTGAYDFDILSTTTDFSFDDTATRYEATLRVDEGTINGLPVTGEGFSVDVFNLMSDGRLNVYMYDSLTLTTDTEVTFTMVIETMGILDRVE